jgi:hypothetical protein
LPKALWGGQEFGPAAGPPPPPPKLLHSPPGGWVGQYIRKSFESEMSVFEIEAHIQQGMPRSNCRNRLCIIRGVTVEEIVALGSYQI